MLFICSFSNLAAKGLLNWRCCWFCWSVFNCSSTSSPAADQWRLKVTFLSSWSISSDSGRWHVVQDRGSPLRPVIWLPASSAWRRAGSERSRTVRLVSRNYSQMWNTLTHFYQIMEIICSQGKHGSESGMEKSTLWVSQLINIFQAAAELNSLPLNHPPLHSQLHVSPLGVTVAGLSFSSTFCSCFILKVWFFYSSFQRWNFQLACLKSELERFLKSDLGSHIWPSTSSKSNMAAAQTVKAAAVKRFCSSDVSFVFISLNK